MKAQALGPNIIDLTISANTQNYNIYNSADATKRTRRAIVTLTINAAVTVGSNSVSVAALDTGTGWVPGTIIRVINNGLILGLAGTGGNGASGYQPYSSSFAGGDGYPGGPAIKLQFAITINNATGIIGGGGGGGGGGAGKPAGSYPLWDSFTHVSGGGGGGGRGSLPGSGGSKGSQASGTAPTDGTAGSASAAGAGGTKGFNAFVGYGGDGGSGGNLGSPGTSGGTDSPYGDFAGGAGGAAGKAVEVNGYLITWEALGSVYGVYW